ncbi:MAG: hypothetical protein IK118_05290 [Clostridia bacterium]|nr:hypothetical protein [Clostridia bacterium]MBR5427742.1 hypothetical protein [Clostridia bacterium]
MYGSDRAIRVLFTDTCNIFAREKSRREDGVTVFDDACVLAGVPCRLSYDTYPAAKQNNRTAHVTGGAVVFLPAGIEVAPGSVFELARDGKIIRLKASGIAKYYPGHVEITVKPAETEA